MYDATYLAAQRRVDAKLGFYAHALVYLCINTGLIGFHWWHGHAGAWLLGPLLGWGSGLLLHGIRVYWRLPAHWRQRMIEQELNHKDS